MKIEEIEKLLATGNYKLVEKSQLATVLAQNQDMKADLQVLIDFVANLYSYFFTTDQDGKPSINFAKLSPLITKLLTPKIPFMGKKDEELSDHPIYVALKIETIEPLYQKYHGALQEDTIDKKELPSHE